MKSNMFCWSLVLTITLQEKNSSNLNILTFPATTPCRTSSRTQRPPCSPYSPCSPSCAWNVLRFLFDLNLTMEIYVFKGQSFRNNSKNLNLSNFQILAEAEEMWQQPAVPARFASLLFFLVFFY